MREFELLLENFWLLKEREPEVYQQVKDASVSLKPFLEHKFGYRLITNADFIKLEKLPGLSEPWMGIQRFETQMEYVFLCFLLIFLESYGKKEQFVLSKLTEFIQSNYPGEEKIDWTLYRHRLSLVKVINFITEIGLIKVDDGESSEFTADYQTEVLYESTGISRYFARNFSEDILPIQDWELLEKNGWFDFEQDRGAIRRQRVYRRLFLSPALLADGLADADFLYLKNYRSMIEKDLADYLSGDLHIHKTSALVMLPEDKYFKETLPDQKAITGIVIQVCTKIRLLLTQGELKLNNDDTLTVAKDQFEKIIDSCRQDYAGGWSKEFREMPSAKLYTELITYMTGFLLLKRLNHQELLILPPAGKIAGSYPKEFGGEDIEQ